MIPFIDLKAQYQQIKSEIDAAIKKVLDNTAFALGFAVEEFEKNFAEYCEVKHVVGVSSGTSALHIALIAAGIEEGDEVITVPNTFIATTEAITLARAVPVFVDVDEESYTIDVNQIEAAITERTKAIIPVYLYGQTADMDPILEIACRYNLLVIEDAAQAHGATYKGKKAGSLGDVACFSFYPAKNLGAYGEAGALATNSDEIAEKARMFRDHGQRQKYVHEFEGHNYRMDGIQGAVLGVKLKHLDNWNQRRREHTSFYNELLRDIKDVIPPKEMPWAKHVYHLYVIRTSRRDSLREYLADRQIATGMHYPIPLHLQEAYQRLGSKKGDFPISEKCADQILSLPMYPEMSKSQIQIIRDEINNFFLQ